MLLWKDFKKQEDCDSCPLKEAELCTGGWVCYGGDPIEPPCCCFEDDTDLEQWVEDAFDRQYRWEAAEDRRIQAQKEKDIKNAEAQKRRREAKREVRSETLEIKSLKKKIAANEAIFRLASSFAFAVNTTNEMFGYSERLTERKSALEEQNKPLLERIARLETIKKEKLKRLREKRKKDKEKENDNGHKDNL